MRHRPLSRLTALIAVAFAFATFAGAAPVHDAIRGHLVALREGEVQPVPADALAGAKYFLLCYGSGADGACRRFVENLVPVYPRMVAANPTLAVILVSSDPSESGMHDWMAEAAMPWPALSWRLAQMDHILTKFGGANIPALALIDENGKLLSGSFDGKLYLGPTVPLDYIEKHLGGGTRPPAAVKPPGSSVGKERSGSTGRSEKKPGGFDDFFKKRPSPSPAKR